MLLNYFPSKGDEKSKKMPFVLELGAEVLFLFFFFPSCLVCFSGSSVTADAPFPSRQQCMQC